MRKLLGRKIFGEGIYNFAGEKENEGKIWRRLKYIMFAKENKIREGKGAHYEFCGEGKGGKYSVKENIFIAEKVKKETREYQEDTCCIFCLFTMFCIGGILYFVYLAYFVYLPYVIFLAPQVL